MTKNWEESIEMINKGTRLLFINDFAAAEQVFKSGMESPRVNSGSFSLSSMSSPQQRKSSIGSYGSIEEVGMKTGGIPTSASMNSLSALLGSSRGITASASVNGLAGMLRSGRSSSQSLNTMSEDEKSDKFNMNASEALNEGLHVRPGLEKERDLRGAFALQYALVSVIKGVSSLANDQLEECLRRLWIAEELAKEDEDWAGRKVVRGVCTLAGGVIQCMQHSFVKGVYNILRSWVWIKCLPTEALEYKGREREIVRSSALLTLGVFNVLLSLLPPSMLKAATFMSGIEGNRDAGLRMLEQCYQEDGIYAPWGALVWVVYQVDTKTFLGEEQTDEDLRACDRVFAWARERYPNSVFFSQIEADLAACRKNVALARAITERISPYVKELRALEWLINYKRGVYALTDMKFAKAARFFENSITVYIQVGRRSMVPFMAIYAALCYLIVAEQQDQAELEEELHDQLGDDDGFISTTPAGTTGSSARVPKQVMIQPGDNTSSSTSAISSVGDASSTSAVVGVNELAFEDGLAGDDDEDSLLHATKAAAHAEEMFILISKYKEMPKDNWGRQDVFAFKLYEKYTSNIASMWPLLDMLESMALRMRCTRFMNDDQADEMVKMVQKEEKERNVGPDQKIRACAYFAEILLQRRRNEESLSWCDKGLKLEPELSAEGKSHGAAPWLIYIRALNMVQMDRILEARQALDRIESYGKDYWLYPVLIFKATVLRKRINKKFDDEFSTLNIPPGKTESVMLTVTEEDLLQYRAIAAISKTGNVHSAIEEDETSAPAEKEGGNSTESGTRNEELMLQWEFNCEKHDISFTSYYRPDDKDRNVLFIQSIERHEDSDGACYGTLAPTVPGVLHLEWDNRYSFVRSKTINYRITCAPKNAKPQTG